MKITTRDYIHGKVVNKELGIVAGNVVKSRMFIRDFFAGIRNFLGKEIIEYTEMLTQTRQVALERMMKQASDIGANAVLNVRFMTSQTSNGASELLAYGTAVVIVDE